jgi:hypothetical protein
LIFDRSLTAKRNTFNLMEIKEKTKTTLMLQVLYIVSWVIFVGVCIEAGGFIFNAFFTLVFNPSNASYFNLSDLYRYDPGYFLVELLLMSIVAVMRACIFYLIVKILHDKKLNMSQPFSKEVGRFTFKVAYLALGIGLFSWWGVKYTEWFVQQGVKMPDVQYLRLGGADVWLFMGVTLFVIAQIFKRGIEIQSENELTV